MAILIILVPLLPIIRKIGTLGQNIRNLLIYKVLYYFYLLKNLVRYL